MSVEGFVISAPIEAGTPKPAFQQGLSSDDFEVYSDEWNWICDSAERRRPINLRRFKNEFPDFEFVLAEERVQDLIDELKQERAYTSIAGIIEQVSRELSPSNATGQAEVLREVISQVLRLHSPTSDIFLTSNWKEHLEHIRQLRILREQGVAPGISTGLKNLDHHWGGLIPGRMVLVLGRPGSAKGFLLAKFFTEAFWQGHRVAMFSPEMNEHEHRCRVATLLSAKSEIQKELGLRRSFRNRALMDGEGFNEKTYKQFWQFLDSECQGEMILFTRKYRREKMSPAFIEAKVEDLGVECMLVDPLYKLKSTERRHLRHEELSDITDAIQDIGESFNIPVVISNQANRYNGNRGDAPSKDQSFGSDAPVHEADHIIGVMHLTEERKILLRCTKNRFGGDFRVDVGFHPNIGKMEDLTPIRGDYFGDDETSDPDDFTEDEDT